jgi:hypothetical protein
MSHRLNVARRGWRPRQDVPTPPDDQPNAARFTADRVAETFGTTTA